MKASPSTSGVLSGVSVVRLMLSAAMFVPIAFFGCAVAGESLGLPPDDDSPVVLIAVIGGSICGLIVGIATRNRRHVNAALAVFGIAGAIGSGVAAVHMATVTAATNGLAALPCAIRTVFWGTAAVACLLAVAVGILGLIGTRHNHVTC